MRVIGFLCSRSPAESEAVVSAFRQGLTESGYIVGQNVEIEYRWAEGRYDRLPALAAKLVGLRVAAVLAAGGPPSALAAKKSDIHDPYYFFGCGRPGQSWSVESLSRPGGNITGMSVFNSTLGAKRFGLLHELVPSAKTIAFLTNPTNPSFRLEVNAVSLPWSRCASGARGSSLRASE